MRNPPNAPKIDLATGAIAHRLRSGEGRGGALARAAGVRPGRELQIVDATAGLGRDALVLASLGCSVTLIERVPIIYNALAEALRAAKSPGAPPELAAAAARMTLLSGDAKVLLPHLGADTVLIDPMHPPRGNSALVKREMRDLRAVVGDDPDAGELIATALATARRRVVVKWPRRVKLPPGIRAPSHSIDGRTTRYDVFVLATGLAISE